MIIINGEALGSILHEDLPGAKPEKAAKKAPAKAESKSEPKSEAKADEPKPKSTFKSALDTPSKSESSEPARNASTEEWAKFLTDQKIDHPEDAGRDELIELFDKSKKG